MIGDTEWYVPRIKGAKELGATQIIVLDDCGGYNMGANLYQAIFPDGSTIDSISYMGNPMGKDNFKKVIRQWYVKKLNNDR